MLHPTHNKGDIAVTKTICSLTEIGYDVFRPVVSEHLPFDLIALKDNKYYRIQVKYSGEIRNKRVYQNKQGNHVKEYDQNDFDYYGLYLPSIDKVVYPSIKFGGKTIASKLSNSAAPFYWWEDFLNFTDKATKRSFKEFGIELHPTQTEARKAFVERSSKMPDISKEELEKLLWSKSTVQIAKDFKVSDTTVANWAKKFGLEKPARGYWTGK